MKTRLTILSLWLGAVFWVSAQTFQAIYNFPSSQGPNGSLVLQNGVLFGTTGGGGTAGSGSVFKITTNGSGFGVLKSFSAVNINTSTNVDGSGSLDGLLVWSNRLFGTTSSAGFGTHGTVFGIGTNGTGFAVLNHFYVTNGKAPYVGLTLWSNALYGATAAGGISNKGAIFRVNPDGSGYTLIKSFLASEGVLLLGRLATDGNTLYGTTLSGGISNRGTIYSIGVNGDNFNVLKTFADGEGSSPRFGLILSGNRLYGVTEGDGFSTSNSIVFCINTDGSDYRVIKRFSEPDPNTGTNWDGDYIGGGLALWNGVLYGSARWGGPNDAGTIFKLNPDGSGFAVLKIFAAPTNPNGGLYINNGGMQPMGDLMVADGVIYGVTRYGGTYGYGVIYRLTIPPTPALTTTNIGGDFVVSWSDDSYNRTLQFTSDLSANWSSVTNLNWTNSSVIPRRIGFRMSGLPTDRAMFFRLR